MGWKKWQGQRWAWGRGQWARVRVRLASGVRVGVDVAGSALDVGLGQWARARVRLAKDRPAGPAPPRSGLQLGGTELGCKRQGQGWTWGRGQWARVKLANDRQQTGQSALWGG